MQKEKRTGAVVKAAVAAKKALATGKGTAARRTAKKTASRATAGFTNGMISTPVPKETQQKRANSI